MSPSAMAAGAVPRANDRQVRAPILIDETASTAEQLLHHPARLAEIHPPGESFLQRRHGAAHVLERCGFELLDQRGNRRGGFDVRHALGQVDGDDGDLLALLGGELGAAGLLVNVERFLALLDHLAHDVEDLGVAELEPLGAGGLARKNRGIDHAERRDAARLARLHRLFYRVVDIVAQHGYGLSQMRTTWGRWLRGTFRPLPMPTQPQTGELWDDPKPTALLVLADGTVLEGIGFGATGQAVGEVCFNTAMTGYEEILTDPSYAGQIITFTFPHIGNVGTNEEDIETVNLAATPGARGVVLHSAITQPSNYRATKHLDAWLKNRGVIGLAGIDTRALTAFIRVKGMPNAVIAHEPSGRFDLATLKREAKAWPGLLGMDLVPMVTTGQRFTWRETPWQWGEGYGELQEPAEFHVVAIDYGIKRNILRQLAGNRCEVTVVPART